MELPESAAWCLKRLNEAGFEAYIVGGAVRSALLHEKPHDFDICTDAVPEETAAVFHDVPVITTGIRHGTVTVVRNGEMYEITTYRTESGYQDHRHPDEVRFTSRLEEDLSRRDFTVNAMAWSPEKGLIDCFGGVRDIENRIIRTVNDPRDRFGEDALRILRALRFAARLGFDIDADTAAALTECAPTLALISPERITAELRGILEAKDCVPVLSGYRQVIAAVLPETGDLDEETYSLIMRRLGRCRPLFEARLALYLEPCATSWKQQLRLSRRQLRDAEDLIRHAEDPAGTVIECRKLLSVLTADPGLYAAFRSARDLEDDDRLSRLFDEIMRRGDVISLSRLAVNGNDLVSAGYSGKQIAFLLDACLQAVMEEKAANDKKDLLALCRQIIQ